MNEKHVILNTEGTNSTENDPICTYSSSNSTTNSQNHYDQSDSFGEDESNQVNIIGRELVIILK